jgi:hypothetical protein
MKSVAVQRTAVNDLRSMFALGWDMRIRTTVPRAEYGHWTSAASEELR